LKTLPLCKTQVQREDAAKRIKDIEHDGDSITHRIYSETELYIVTPIDREDIHELASALDDILDQIDGCANRFALYKITRIPKAVISTHRCAGTFDGGIKEWCSSFA